MERTVKLIYRLSDAGRKASILTGGDGRQEQVVEVPITEELMSLTHVHTAGDIAPIYVGFHVGFGSCVAHLDQLVFVPTDGLRSLLSRSMVTKMFALNENSPPIN